jgi:hypothetical protein
MDKEEILALLRKKSTETAASAKQSAEGEAINRLAAALTVPVSFGEIEWDLPPMARYLGPGVWMDAIKAGRS